MAVAGFCRNSNTDGPTGKDAALGFFMRHLQIANIRTGAAPIAADVDVFVAAILPTTGGTQTFTILTQPDVPRNVTMNLTDANSSIQEVRATVKGLDQGFNPITEFLVLSATPGTSQAVGTQAFYQIDSITAVTTGTPGGGDVVSFGCGTGLGIPFRIGEEGDIKAKRVDAVQDTTGVVTINANGWATWVPASLPNAARTYFVSLKSSYSLP